MKTIFFGILFLFLSGCTSVPDIAYHKEKPFNGIHIIEANDKGEFHNINELNYLIKNITKNQGKTHLVIFSHGWHHNAKPNDRNLKEFQKFISQLKKNDSHSKTIGIYFGWRGEESTGFNYLSLGSRKKISNLVGKNALNKTISSIKKVILNNSNVRLTVIGHSLGGSVVFNSIKEELSTGSFDFNKRFKFIMLNPAFSAKEFEEAIKGISKKQLNKETETPIVIMQSNNDWAVKWLLPIFTSNSSIGFSKKYITHGSWACGNQDFECIKRMKEKHNNNLLCSRVIQNNKWYIHTSNGTNKYNTFSCKESWNLPILVIQNAHTISGTHNEILTNSEAQALLDFIEIR